MLGNYEDGTISAKLKEAITGTKNGQFVKKPMFYASKLIAEAIREEGSYKTNLLTSTDDDDATVIMALESAPQQANYYANGGTLPNYVTKVVYVYLLNKRPTAYDVTVEFDEMISDKLTVHRYSETETDAPEIEDPTSVARRDASDKRLLHVTMEPFSLTRVNVHLNVPKDVSVDIKPGSCPNPNDSWGEIRYDIFGRSIPKYNSRTGIIFYLDKDMKPVKRIRLEQE